MYGTHKREKNTYHPHIFSTPTTHYTMLISQIPKHIDGGVGGDEPGDSAQVATNTAAIATEASKIVLLANVQDSNSNNIAANAVNITNNDNTITTQAGLIANNTAAIGTNSTNIANNAANITTLQGATAAVVTWHTGTPAFTFASGFNSYKNGLQFLPVRVAREHQGDFYLIRWSGTIGKGSAGTETWGNGATMFTLGVGYRPSKRVQLCASGNPANTMPLPIIMIEPTGEVKSFTSASFTGTSWHAINLDGISFLGPAT